MESGRKDPYGMVCEWCQGQGMPHEFIQLIPKSYLHYGSTLVLRFPPGIPESYEHIMAEGWARTLGMDTVLKRTGIVRGTYREPSMTRILGAGGEVDHIENGVAFRFDPERILFSPGNQPERIRMGRVDMQGETVVDMFAGIGYFSLPAAIHGKAAKVFACEINPVSHAYLKQNIEINGSNSIIPLLGDNREVASEGIADRIIMGYVGTTHLFLQKAFSCLGHKGIIHYHEICPLNLFPDATIRRIELEARKFGGLELDVMRIQKVKSYGPKMLHVVADVHVEKGEREQGSKERS